MPVYEYVCSKCGHEFEELGKRDHTPACPKCGSMHTTRLMSTCARRSKGSADGSYTGAGACSTGGCGGCSGGNCASCGR